MDDCFLTNFRCGDARYLEAIKIAKRMGSWAWIQESKGDYPDLLGFYFDRNGRADLSEFWREFEKLELQQDEC